MARTIRLVAVTLTLATVLAGCGEGKKTETNVRPPHPGIPSTEVDVTGIYRTRHQGLIQLRANGGFVMVISGKGPSAGTWTLRDGVFQVRTGPCGDQPGEYRAEVTGEALPGKAILHLRSVRDDCVERQRYLTIDPWIYAVS